MLASRTHQALAREYLTPSEPAGDRTQGLRIKSPLLYQLSYRLQPLSYPAERGGSRFTFPSPGHVRCQAPGQAETTHPPGRQCSNPTTW